MMNKRQIMSLLTSFSWLKIISVVAALVVIGCIALAFNRNRSPAANGYATHTGIPATIFWIGEPGDDSNGQISNVPMAWDDNAAARFGGNDGPTTKDGSPTDVKRDSNGVVASFRPKHNPFYFALPAAEFNDKGVIAKARQSSPWHDQTVGDDRSLFKGRWIKVTNGDKTVYAQWLDVGPNVEDDYRYVFGNGKQKPKNTFGLKAGLDLSPAAAISLGFNDDSKQVSWQFVDSHDVPDGPWKQYPAINNITYWD